MAYAPTIESLLKGASRIARKYHGKVNGTTKPEDNNQVLTKADIEIGKYLIAKIQKQFPTHSIIDEEAGVIDKDSPYVWVVDPIDGTSNFASGLHQYGIMIGLLKDGKPLAGGIALPTYSMTCIAERGKGAFCNGKRMQVTKTAQLSKALVACGIDGHQEDPQLTREECAQLAEIVLGVRNLRTSNCCYDTVMVAMGKYGGQLNRTSRIWDNIAQQIIVEEAGGLYTDFFGRHIDYSNPIGRVKDNFTWCAASAKLHAQLQAIIHKRN